MNILSTWSPMLAASTVPSAEEVPFPCMASVKLDGIRSPIIDGKAMSRKLLPLPNVSYQEWVYQNRQWVDGVDCEVISGSPVGEGVFHRTQSAIMSIEGTPDFKLYVFDLLRSDPALPAYLRYRSLQEWFATLPPSVREKVVLVEQRFLQSIAELKQYMSEAMDLGFEGLILKHPQRGYKCGRSSVKEGALLKWKEFAYEECRILNVLQGETNINPKVKDALGHSKRSSAKAGKVLVPIVGGFEVIDVKTGVVFSCSTGLLKEDELKALWSVKDSLLGRVFTYKSQPYGVLKKPRFPGFHGWKSAMDMDTPVF